MNSPPIALIAAMAHHRVLGKDNKMPWHLPADLAYFKKVTFGKPIVMGRKTFDSLGRPLPGRRNIVITRQKNLSIPGVECLNSLEQALDLLKNEAEIMIIGGATIFEQALPIADELYLTYIDLDCEGDTFFPEFNEQDFIIASQEAHKRDEKNKFDYQFLHLTRA